MRSTTDTPTVFYKEGLILFHRYNDAHRNERRSHYYEENTDAQVGIVVDGGYAQHDDESTGVGINKTCGWQLEIEARAANCIYASSL